MRCLESKKYVVKNKNYEGSFKNFIVIGRFDYN